LKISQYALKKREILESSGTVTYSTPSRAVKTLSFLVAYGELRA